MTYQESKTFRGHIRRANYRARWWLARYVTPRAPVHLDIEINSTCNLRCPICHQSDEPRVYSLKHMPEADAIRRLDEAKRIGVRSIKLNWRGEALIHPDFWGILRHALSLDFDDMLINTNLSVVMTDEQIELLSHIPSIKVSIDSVTNYKEARRGGDLELVMENIVRLFRYRERLETNRHESSLTEPFEKYVNQFRYKLYQKITQRNGIGEEARRNWNERELIDIPSWSEALAMTASIKMHNGKAQVRNAKLDVFMPDGGRKRVYCGMPSRRLLLSAVTGKAYPCCVPYAEKDDMVVGQKDVSLLDSWRNAGRFRSGLKKTPAGWTETCLNCASSDAWAK